jgi:hypothetical protein
METFFPQKLFSPIDRLSKNKLYFINQLMINRWSSDWVPMQHCTWQCQGKEVEKMVDSYVLYPQVETMTLVSLWVDSVLCRGP